MGAVLGGKIALSLHLGWAALAVGALSGCAFDRNTQANPAAIWRGCFSSGSSAPIRLEIDSPASNLLSGTLEIPEDDEVYGLSGSPAHSTLAVLDGTLAGRPDLTNRIELLRSSDGIMIVHINEGPPLGPLESPCP